MLVCCARAARLGERKYSLRHGIEHGYVDQAEWEGWQLQDGVGYTRKYGKKEDWVSVKLEGSKVLEIRFARWESMVLNRIRSLFCLFFEPTIIFFTSICYLWLFLLSPFFFFLHGVSDKGNTTCAYIHISLLKEIDTLF